MFFAVYDAENAAYVETPTLPSQVEKYLCYLVPIKSKILKVIWNLTVNCIILWFIFIIYLFISQLVVFRWSISV